MKLKLKVWRQQPFTNDGKLEEYEVDDLSHEMYFFDLMDRLNAKLEQEGIEPVVYDYACREGNCGQCSLFINGKAHGPEQGMTTCRTSLRQFKDGETLTIEPFRSCAFPIKQDLKIDREALDKIMEAGDYMRVKSTGGLISMDTGNYIAPPAPLRAPEGSPFSFEVEDTEWIVPSFDEVAPKVVTRKETTGPNTCITCGACVAACRNSAAMLFTSAKLEHFNSFEEEEIEKEKRAVKMVRAMDNNGFGNCSNYGDCEAVCPKGVTIDWIAKLNKTFFKGSMKQIKGKIKEEDLEVFEREE